VERLLTDQPLYSTKALPNRYQIWSLEFSTASKVKTRAISNRKDKAVTIKEAIASLTRMVESGGFREDDDLYITWWSYEDVLLVADGSLKAEDQEMDNEEAREIWAKVYNEIECWDDVDNQQVQQEIYTVLESEKEKEE
jgi:hypothetical protein